MAHGGYGKRRVAGVNLGPSKSKTNTKEKKKSKIVSVKNQIRSVQRLLRKDVPLEMKEAQQKRLDDLTKQAELHARTELERKMALRYRKVKFFERRKVERSIRRLEKLQRSAADHPSDEMVRQAVDVEHQLAQLKEDLEYIKFFPKTEKYISLFTSNEEESVKATRTKLREQIKANLRDAAAAGIEIEETGSDDDGAIDMSEDDFFLANSSSDDADADDEWTDKSPRVADDRDETSKEVIVSLSPKTRLLNPKKQLHKKNPHSSSLAPHNPRQVSHWKSNEAKNRKRATSAMPPRHSKMQKRVTSAMPPRHSNSNKGTFRPPVRVSTSSGNYTELEKPTGSRWCTSSTTEESGKIDNYRISSKNRTTSIKPTSHHQHTNASLDSNTPEKPKRKRTRSKKKKNNP